MSRAAKPVTLHPCGTCDLTLPTDADPKTLWCHGGPPGPFVETVVTYPPGGGQPIPSKNLSSQYPPVGVDKPGCALHPKLRGKIFGGRR